MNSQANKTARLAQNLGWKKGDTVALFIHNEPAFIWTYLGKCYGKVGVKQARSKKYKMQGPVLQKDLTWT